MVAFFTQERIFKKKLKKFDLIIDLQSKFRNTFILKKIPHDFYSKTFNGIFQQKK